MSHSALGKPDVKARPQAQAPFCMVPLEIAADPDLSPGAKLLFGVILTLTKGAWGRCCARNEKLAEMTGLCVEQVRRLLRDLEDRDLIARIMEGNQRIEIKIKWTPAQIQNVPGGGYKMPAVQIQNVPPYEIPDEMTEDSAARPKKRKPRCFPIDQNCNLPAPPVPDDDPAATAAAWALGPRHFVELARIAAEGGAP